MCHFLEHCVRCPHWQDCPDFQEAFDEYYDEVQQEQDAKAEANPVFVIYSGYIPIFDDNDPTTRGIYHLPSVAPPADHHSPSATE